MPTAASFVSANGTSPRPSDPSGAWLLTVSPTPAISGRSCASAEGAGGDRAPPLPRRRSVHVTPAVDQSGRRGHRAHEDRSRARCADPPLEAEPGGPACGSVGIDERGDCRPLFDISISPPSPVVLVIGAEGRRPLPPPPPGTVRNRRPDSDWIGSARLTQRGVPPPPSPATRSPARRRHGAGPSTTHSLSGLVPPRRFLARGESGVW